MQTPEPKKIAHPSFMRLRPSAREEMERYIFAVAFLTRKDRVLGVLYGAGASEQCDRNQIFGYWLQKRLLLTAITGARSDLNPKSWSSSDASFLIISGIRKGVRDEEEVHAAPNRFFFASGGKWDANC
jgi:hypothetical protein